MSGSKHQKGFTLLEVLIAITLLGFITLGVISVTDNAIDNKDRTAELNKNNLAIESALARFEWDFQQIYSPLYFSTVMNMQSMVMNPANNNDSDNDNRDDNTGLPINQAGGAAGGAPANINPQLQAYYEQVVERMQLNERFSGLSKEGLPIPRFYNPERNVFEFFTSSNRRKTENVKQSNFAWVRYGLTDMSPEQQAKNDEEKVKGAEIPKNLKNFTRWFDPNDPWGTKRIEVGDLKGAVILENVEALEFAFWDPQKKKWETTLRTVQQGQGLIRGVRIFITWYDSAGVKRSAERIFRNHWPMVVPQDNVQAGAAAGVQGTAGTQGTGGTQGGNPGGFQ